MNKFKGFHFDGQKDREIILSVVHRHWFDILIQFVALIAMFLLFLGGFFFIPIFLPNFEEVFGTNLFYFLQSSLFLFIWMLFFAIWIDYYFDAWIVTDERIVDIEQRGLFARGISELQLENIQDITVEVSGVIPTFLNYGNLYVQTAAEKARFTFRNVPDPYALKNLVMNLQKSYERKETQNLGAVIRKEIHDELS